MKFETKIKLQDWFIRHNTYLSRGQGFAYQWKTSFQLIFYPTAILTYLGLDIPIKYLFLAGAIYIVFFWWLGRYLDKVGFFHREAEFGNKRDPFAKQIRKKLNIKEDLEEDNKT